MKYCLLVLSTLLVIASCKKVETPLSKQEKMRASDWVIDTATITYLTSMGQDSFTKGVWPEKTNDKGELIYPRPDCLKDDYFKFGANYSGTQVTGPNKCGDSETSEIEFSWSIYQGDTKMYMYGLYSLLGQDATGDLVEFNDDNFTFAFPKQIAVNSTIITVKYTLKFKKK